MKVLLDENLPPALAKSLAALFIQKHEIIHLRERFGPKVTDIQWITELSREGGWIIISGDRRIARNRAEQMVFRSSRLIAFIFTPGLQKASTLKKMERLMAVWETIEKQVELVSGGSMFEIQVKGSRLQSI